MTIVRALAGGLAVLLATGLGLLALLLLAGFVATSLIAARVEARHPPGGAFVDLAGGRLSYIEAGPREGARGIVVLLHGASANAFDPMEGFGRRLVERGFRVLAFDRPGFGWSDRFDAVEAASPAYQAGVIAQALDVLGIGPALVYGHSWGGAPALSLASARPDKVAGLILAAPVGMPMPERPLPWWARAALYPPVTRLLAHTVAVPLGLYYLPRAADTVFRPEPTVPDYVERSRAALILRPGPALANIQDLAGLPAALRLQAPRYAALRVPTTIVTGDADPVVRPDAQAAQLAATIPGAQLVRLPGVGHMLHFTAPDRVVAAIEALQARLDSASSQ